MIPKFCKEILNDREFKKKFEYEKKELIAEIRDDFYEDLEDIYDNNKSMCEKDIKDEIKNEYSNFRLKLKYEIEDDNNKYFTMFVFDEPQYYRSFLDACFESFILSKVNQCEELDNSVVDSISFDECGLFIKFKE